MIKTQKDPIPANMKKNVVYKISCNECDASCVGQTSRQLKTRIHKHKNDINRSKLTNSILSEGKCHNHNFNWDKVNIPDNERNYNKELIFEMINIKRYNYQFKYRHRVIKFLLQFF